MSFLHLPMGTRSQAAEWNLQLGFPNFRFADLNRVRRLMALDQLFRNELLRENADLARKYELLRADPNNPFTTVETSEILIDVAKHVGQFIAQLFTIRKESDALDESIVADNPVFACKRQFIDRRVLKEEPTEEQIEAMDVTDLEFHYRELIADTFDDCQWADDPEQELAELVMNLLGRQATAKTQNDLPALAALENKLQKIENWARAIAFHPQLRARRKAFCTFVRPEKLEFEDLVPREFPNPLLPILSQGPEETRRFRDGFVLTDPRMSRREALREAHYCIICHPREKDSCSTGFVEKDGSWKRNPLGIPLTGCPLDEKISEAHELKREGHSIAALAMVMVENPLCAGTGHRICNDCMKSCIYQKQTPVNIPELETRILTDVLNLPYGFELYSLFTKWNPLNTRRPYPLPYNGKNVLVVGLGPAGYTLANYLLNEGFGVVGIDGLKIEPLPVRMRGAKRRVPQPIQDIHEITSKLDQRTILGFGGVSEYGITVRWDKNFLDINYLVLMRRKKFRLYDGVRFGGTLTIDDAWRLGFHHIAICAGAGRPTMVAMKNNMLRGVRQASDFLMGLQATGIYKKDALGNLQVELPAVIIGGGLTAIDTATELQAYYVVQCEKTLERYERLCEQIGVDAIHKKFLPTEMNTLNTWLRHGRAIRTERSAATAAGREPDFNRLVRGWGGVTLAYRKRMQDSPAYRLNHEEVIKALEEGISFAECVSPIEAVSDAENRITTLRCEVQGEKDGKWFSTGQIVDLPARSVMVAAGTKANCIYEREFPGTFKLDAKGEFYLGHKLVENEDGSRSLLPVDPRKELGFFTSYQNEDKLISFFGDNHPKYAGNVVKAMASSKDGTHKIVDAFAKEIAALDPYTQSERERNWVLFAEVLDDQLLAEVVDAFRLTSTIVEVIVKAPLAAKNFQPGMFYRLQNYEAFAEKVAGFTLTMEGIALTGAWVDRERGLVSLIVLEMGGSSRLCALLEPGEKVVLMGPTGTPTEIPDGEETVLLLGGGLGNAVLFSIAAALKQKGNRVLYFAGYKHPSDVFKRSEIEEACDNVIWSTDIAPALEPRRPQDSKFVGNIVQAVKAYGDGQLGDHEIKLADVDRIIAIGSDRMMAAVKDAVNGSLSSYFPKRPIAIGSINSPMQCMMKEICAQCLQRHIDPETGEESYVFSCFNQDQFLNTVDFANLNDRLKQNIVAEKLTSLWIDHLFQARMVQQV